MDVACHCSLGPRQGFQKHVWWAIPVHTTMSMAAFSLIRDRRERSVLNAAGNKQKITIKREIPIFSVN